MASPDTFPRSQNSIPMAKIPVIQGFHERRLLLRFRDEYRRRRGGGDPPGLDKIRITLKNRPPTRDHPVCIIGAGMAGLYTAMIFESLGISYQIVDADTRARVGGRIFTHHFPGGEPYDYYVCWIPVFSHHVLIFAYRTLELCGSHIHHS